VTEPEHNLGKASLSLTADLTAFEANVKSGERTSEGLRSKLDALAAVAKICEEALNDVKMGAGQAAESRTSAESILTGVRGVSEQARAAARELDRVRITESQATESDVAGDRIKSNLDDIGDKARRARREMESVRVAGGRNGVGVGPFGSGFGRVGVLGTGIGLGALTAPAAGPAAIGLLATLPTLATGAVGALGTLALAFQHVGAAIGGDKKAFEDLQPSAKQFVLTVRSLDGWLDKLRQTAGAGVFPGLTAGLKAALSPGTVNAITTAVQEFSRAIGQAAQQWGRYFGSRQFSAIFGPLMKDGARNLGVFSSTMLHLADAVGVVARAAIPFTNWLVDAVARGAKLLDQWASAKSASGALARAMNEARTSLQLVWGLFKSLVGVVAALGRALYPVSKVAVKDLTDGLHWLAQQINRNRKGVADFVGGALQALVDVVKIAAPLVVDLGKGLGAVVRTMGGWKSAFEIVTGGFLAGKLLGLTGGISGVGKASSTAAGAAETLRGKLGALAAVSPIRIAVAVAVTATFYGAAKSFFEKYLGVDFTGIAPDKPTPDTIVSKFHLTAPQGTSDAALLEKVRAGSRLSKRDRDALVSEFAAGLLTGGHKPTLAEQGELYRALLQVSQAAGAGSAHGGGGGLGTLPLPDGGSTAGDTNVFGKPPAWTKNLGPKPPKPPVIPGTATHALQLASANASKATAAGGTGKTAERYLNLELADLQTAAKLIDTKYQSATGKARTQLFGALTNVQNKIRMVRAEIGKTITTARASSLQFAVDQAKLAVASAAAGSAAWKTATAAEEKALKAEIAYLDKRAKNTQLSTAAREKAIRAELAAKKELAALLKPVASSVAQNEAQFLRSATDILFKFAPNAQPQGALEVKQMGQVAAHLHELKHESRQQTRFIKRLGDAAKFPATDYGLRAVAAVAG
jgi:hypothetical protein